MNLRELATKIENLTIDELTELSDDYRIDITIRPMTDASGGDGDNDADDGAGGVHDGPNDV